MSSNSSAVEQLRSENPESNFYTILAWWYASETSARAREAEKATSLAEAARAARRARASSGKVAALLDQPELTKEHDPADVKAIEALALTAAVDAETADRHAIRWANPQSSAEDIMAKPSSFRRGTASMTFYGSDELVPKNKRVSASRKDAKALREDATRLAEKTRRNLERVLKTKDPHLADRLAADMRATARLFHDLLAAAGTRDIDLRVFLVSCALRATADATKAERYVQQRFQITHADNDYVTVIATGDDDKVVARVVDSRPDADGPEPVVRPPKKMPLRFQEPRHLKHLVAYVKTFASTTVNTLLAAKHDRAELLRAAKPVAAKAGIVSAGVSAALILVLCFTFPCLPKWQLASQRVVGWNVGAKNPGLSLEFTAAVTKPGPLPYAVSAGTFTVDRVSRTIGLTSGRASGDLHYYDSESQTAVLTVSVPYRLDVVEHGLSAGFNAILDRNGRGPNVAFDLTLDATLRLLKFIPIPLNMRCHHVVKLSRPVPQVDSAQCTYTIFNAIPLLRKFTYRSDAWVA